MTSDYAVPFHIPFTFSTSAPEEQARDRFVTFHPNFTFESYRQYPTTMTNIASTQQPGNGIHLTKPGESTALNLLRTDTDLTSQRTGHTSWSVQP
jgi:hypothetical protein